jgi:hypothetical protein
MDEEADLPDHDYEAIYGSHAFYQRFRARVTALERHFAATAALRLDQRLSPTAEPDLPYAPAHYTYAVQWFADAQCFRATVAEFPQLRAHGVTPTGTLLTIIDEVARHLHKAHAAGQSIPPPGSFTSSGNRTPR